MLCGISGEAPQVPVASAKSGTVYEKRLIEAYIAEHGKDPISGEELTTDDLIELKTARTVKPRPPTLTSIPSLLSVFQNEWDAVALQLFTLQQQLAQTRQELSTALYQNDAAVRVIGRLMKERDEAREALAKISIGAGATAGGDEMQIDNQALPEQIVAKIQATQDKLSAGRKKRAVPADWTSTETISQFNVAQQSEELYPGGKAVALDGTGDLVLTGGIDGIAGIYSISQNTLVAPLKADGGAITDVLWAGSKPITASSSGAVRLWDDQGESSTKIGTHAGEVTGIALHPCGEILASVGVDKSWVTYDLEAGKPVTQVFTDHGLTTVQYHPDGHLIALGTDDTTGVLIYDTKTASPLATFGPLSGPVKSMHFSENGYLLAVAVEGETAVQLWSLRTSAKTKDLDTGARVDSVRWELSGNTVAAVGPSGVSVYSYSKSTKQWSETLKRGVPGVAIAWGPKAGSLVELSKEGIVSLLKATA